MLRNIPPYTADVFPTLGWRWQCRVDYLQLSTAGSTAFCRTVGGYNEVFRRLEQGDKSVIKAISKFGDTCHP